MKQQRLFEIIYALMAHEACTVSELARMPQAFPCIRCKARAAVYGCCLGM